MSESFDWSIGPRSLDSSDPQRLGEYRLTRRLRRGEQGEVYDGHAEDGTRVAVKVPHSHRGCPPSLMAQEAAAARRVVPFCAARILQARLEESAFFIVSEFADGPDLFQMLGEGTRPADDDLYRALEEGPRLAGDDLYRLAVGVVTALTALHEAEVIHGDLKPADIHLGSQGLRVTGFGVSHSMKGFPSPLVGVHYAERLERRGPYVAPEAYGDAELAKAGDVYAWGAIMLWAATGLYPYHLRTAFGLDHIRVEKPNLRLFSEPLRSFFNKALFKDPDDLRSWVASPEVSGMPEVLRPLVGAALAKDPSARPTAHMILNALVTSAGASDGEVGDQLAAGAAMAGPSYTRDLLLSTGSR